MKQHVGILFLLTLSLSAHADIVQISGSSTLSGHAVSYGSDTFELQPTNALPMKVPANTVTSNDFPKGVVPATVELVGQKPLTGKIWLYTRGALNFDDDKGETTRLPVAKVSRVLFSAQPVP